MRHLAADEIHFKSVQLELPDPLHERQKFAASCQKRQEISHRASHLVSDPSVSVQGGERRSHVASPGTSQETLNHDGLTPTEAKMTTRNQTPTKCTATQASASTHTRRSRRWHRIILALAVIPALLTLTVSTASADEPVKVKEINFEEDRIEGDLMVPQGERVGAEERDDLVSLVDARSDFADKLLSDVLEL